VQQHIHITKSKARSPIFMLDDDRGKALIFQQRQELCSMVINPGTNLPDYLTHLISPSGAVVLQPLDLPLKIRSLVPGGHPRIDGN
jgi:hypothetical protein